MKKLLALLRLGGDRNLRIIFAGYLAVILAVAVVPIFGETRSGVAIWLGFSSACVATALVLFAAHHLRMARENRQLAVVGEQLDHKAHSDALTGLMNRIGFNKVLVEQSRVCAHGEIAILFLDLNRFKEINDSLGYKAGDKLLAEVARLLIEKLPGAVAVARTGGDEFAAILPVTHKTTAEFCASAIVEALRQPLLVDGQLIQSGLAIGIAYGNLAYDEGEVLLKHADIAMYEAKAAGVNGFRVFDDVMEERMSSRVSIRSELGRALASDELVLHYQPLICARTGKLSSVEALLRWNSPRLGHVSPAVLIPIAEESGQIIELSNWVLDKGLAAIKILGDVPVAINISPVHFRQNGFANLITEKLIAADVQPDLLHLEITEGVLISHMEAARKTIARLRSLGCKVYLDDFGTGYSSLSYLQNFELDGMKIDKSFLRDLGERSQATQIMRSVIDLGHSLDLKVVAEGVESDWQARLLQLLNCDILQGFHFATPMLLEEIPGFRTQQAAASGAGTDPAAPERLSA